LIPSLQQFGGRSWTQDKLDRVRKYLVAYSTIMKSQRYRYAYIDGFAGTGYHEPKSDEGGQGGYSPNWMSRRSNSSTARRE
jgi:three-Cys-motif partner protein